MSDEPKDLFSEPTMTTQRKKRKRAKSAQVFKPYVQDQNMLLPPSLEELIPEKHLVRVINTTIEGLKLDALLATYKGGGASAYYPKMLLKVLIYE
jgi:transposase